MDFWGILTIGNQKSLAEHVLHPLCMVFRAWKNDLVAHVLSLVAAMGGHHAQGSVKQAVQFKHSFSVPKAEWRSQVQVPTGCSKLNHVVCSCGLLLA